MREGRLEEAIRCFQRLADDAPEIKLFNIYAAQAHVVYMQKHGWDIGYDARARRYLKRAQALGPQGPRETAMEDIIAQLYAAEAALQER